jgi:putative hydrolase of the HAD superfamily
MEAVIFDYGGVLCFFPPDSEVDDLARACGMERNEFLKNYWSDRLRYDKGELTTAEYWNNLGRRVGRTYTDEQIAGFDERDVRFWLHYDQRMIDWALSLKKRLKIGLLSNMPRSLGEYMKRHCAFLNDFDHVTLSYELRTVKPEPAIYEHACRALGVKPEQALFLDDKPENVVGAKNAGLGAELFQSAEAFSRLARENGRLMGLGSTPVVIE